MDFRRLYLLLELSRLGSMREFAETHGLTTSTVSQQIAALARDVGTTLVEPDGRRVRLTPAGRRLADHAVTILAAVDTARSDLDPLTEPAGTLRVGGFATAIRRSLMPLVATLASTHPAVQVLINEYEPLEAFTLLAQDDLDLALTYDYNLAPAALGNTVAAVTLWSTPWGLGVPARSTSASPVPDLGAWADHPWIVNSRNTADEDAVRTLASLAGFSPRISHQIDSLDLVEDLILAGQGVGLLPLERETRPGVRVLELADPPVLMTTYAVTRLGRESWAPLRLLLDLLSSTGGPSGRDDGPGPSAGSRRR
ncbi:MAG: putative LysR family transcriptional regulator [Marmoricola sp.]|nr:putative LysR family transcriptional regulator [Marmoricola sp.]